MLSRRDLLVLGVGLGVGLLLSAILPWVVGPGGSSVPRGIDGTEVRIDGTVRSVDAENRLLYVNASGNAPTPLGISNATPFECDTGGNLVTCTGRRSWSWIEPEDRVCVTATLRSDGAPEARRVFVNASCSTALN